MARRVWIALWFLLGGLLIIAVGAVGLWMAGRNALVTDPGFTRVSTNHSVGGLITHGTYVATGALPVYLVEVTPRMTPGARVVDQLVTEGGGIGAIRTHPAAWDPRIRIYPLQGYRVAPHSIAEIAIVYAFAGPGRYELTDVTLTYSVLGLRFQTTLPIAAAVCIRDVPEPEVHREPCPVPERTGPR